MRMEITEGNRPVGPRGAPNDAHVSSPPLPTSAFSLLEVMVALGIFFAAMFAILGLVSGTLRNLRSLQQNEPDPGMIAAQIALTNVLFEGVDSGDFDKLYRGYTWDYEIMEITNGLFRMDIAVHHRVGRQDVPSRASVLFYRPNSPRGRGGATLQ